MGLTVEATLIHDDAYGIDLEYKRITLFSKINKTLDDKDEKMFIQLSREYEELLEEIEVAKKYHNFYL
jgi:uncharacterized protein YpiB (UPF0302 family)